jgi:hypothetical protein
MEVTILKETEDSLYVQWRDKKKGFGRLVITYDDKGGYHVDAEHMGLRTVMEIIKKVAEL